MQQLPLFTVRKRIFGHFPWGLFVLLFLWIALGLINLYSATYQPFQAVTSPLFRSQVIWVGLGGGLLLLTSWLNYQLLELWAYKIYALSLCLLGLVFVTGRSVAGQQNWVMFHGFSFQPSEMAKLTLILVLARYYSERPRQQAYRVKDLIKPLLLLAFPMGMVIFQRDLGGSAFFLLLFMTITLFVKIPIRYFVIAGVLLSILGVGGYHFLKDYQKARIHTFLNPESDPRGRGYHLVQSKIAVGSGGVLGKGYLKGNINKLKYLPERHTDFIFSVLAEEWGFLGALVLLIIITLFLLLNLQTAFESKDEFGALVAIGIVGLFFWHLVINLGGVLGLIPLTGVPFPLLSYGGSSILTLLIGAGILFSIRMRRFVF